MYSHAACVDLTKLYLSSISEFTSKPPSIAVPLINCQMPEAPDGETTFSNPLSIIAKNLKSLGILFLSSIGSIIGKNLLALLK